jgi:hypothetical protein
MPNNPMPPVPPKPVPEVKIVIHINTQTGQIDRMEGPLHMKAFMIETLATAIQMAVQHEPPQPPSILIPVNGNGHRGAN